MLQVELLLEEGFGLSVNPERLVREFSLQECECSINRGVGLEAFEFERNLEEVLDCTRCGIRINLRRNPVWYQVTVLSLDKLSRRVSVFVKTRISCSFSSSFKFRKKLKFLEVTTHPPPSCNVQ